MISPRRGCTYNVVAWVVGSAAMDYVKAKELAKKGALTALLLVLAVGAVLIFLGWLILNAVDSGGNMSSAYEILKKIHDAGTINVGAGVLVLLGFFGTAALIMAIWGRWPFNRAGSATTHVSEGYVTIHSAKWGPTPSRSKDVTDIVRSNIRDGSLDFPVNIETLGDPFEGVGKYLTVTYSIPEKKQIAEKGLDARLVLPPARLDGIAIVKSLTIHRRDADARTHANVCECVVDLVRVAGNRKMSPREFTLKDKKGTELCRIGVKDKTTPAVGHGSTVFAGTIDDLKLFGAIQATMPNDPSNPVGYFNQSMWHGRGGRPRVFCFVDMRASDGGASSHEDSGIKMAYELAGQQSQAFIVQVTSDLVPEEEPSKP